MCIIIVFYPYLCQEESIIKNSLSYFSSKIYVVGRPSGNWTLFCLLLNQKIWYGYSKEPSQWDGSFEHQKHMFRLLGKKSIIILRSKILLNWTYVVGTWATLSDGSYGHRDICLNWWIRNNPQFYLFHVTQAFRYDYFSCFSTKIYIVGTQKRWFFWEPNRHNV